MSRTSVVVWTCILIVCIMFWVFVGHFTGWTSIAILFIAMILFGTFYHKHKHFR